MFNQFRKEQFQNYQKARNFFVSQPEILISLEKYLSQVINQLLQDALLEITTDYNEASALFPFWETYPPDDQGRMPRGDQYPWIEVGENAVGSKLPRLLDKAFEIRDPGLPSGPDERFLLSSKKIHDLTEGFTNAVWLMIDIKSVGPRDNFPHAVMSHNQISGDGNWEIESEGVKNTVLKAVGKRSQHLFHASLSPLYVLSDGTIAPTITLALKPVYKMLNLEPGKTEGQPLEKLVIATIPNGLLLCEKPGYLQSHEGLLYPGKDDRSKNPLKVRCRVSFDLLKEIADWRISELYTDTKLSS